MALKFFSFLTPFNCDLLAYASAKFAHVHLVKPLSSRPLNSETYLIGVGFKGQTMKREWLLRLLDRAEREPEFAANMWKYSWVTGPPPTQPAALSVLKPLYMDQIQHLDFFSRSAARGGSECSYLGPDSGGRASRLAASLCRWIARLNRHRLLFSRLTQIGNAHPNPIRLAISGLWAQV